MSPLPFRLKIALLSAAISGLVLMGFGAASGYLLYRVKLASVDAELRAIGSRHPGWFANRANFDRFTNSLQFVFGEEHLGQVIFLVKDAQGRPLHIPLGWPQALDPHTLDCTLAEDPSSQKPPASVAEASEPSGPPWRGVGKGRGGAGRGLGPGRGGSPLVFNKIPLFLTVKTAEGAWRLGILGNDELRLVVGLDYNAVAADLRQLRNIFLLTLPAALLLVGGGGWLVAGRALRPLRAITDMAEQVTAGGLDQRVPASNADPEIGRLIQVLNRMMERLEASFNQATRFSADASHELKTPLAILQGELEQAVQTSEPGSPQQQLFTSLLEQTQRLKTITRGLLLLAQADAGRLQLAREELDLSASVEAAVEDARALAADGNLHFEVRLQPALRVRADRTLLQLAVLNLLSNAVKYNVPGGSVGVTLTATESQLMLTICNSGPGIPPADQPRIFDRFYRVKGLQVPVPEGLGLGLSLAREAVQAHGGELRLEESRPGYTCFALSLPRLAAENRACPKNP